MPSRWARPVPEASAWRSSAPAGPRSSASVMARATDSESPDATPAGRPPVFRVPARAAGIAT